MSHRTTIAVDLAKSVFPISSRSTPVASVSAAGFRARADDPFYRSAHPPPFFWRPAAHLHHQTRSWRRRVIGSCCCLRRREAFG
jgi:hypothetical protein